MRKHRSERPTDAAVDNHRRHRKLITHLLARLSAPFKRGEKKGRTTPEVKQDAAGTTRSPWVNPAPVNAYSSWVENLIRGDEVAIGNSQGELTDLARVAGTSPTHVRLEGIDTRFWRIAPHTGIASGVRRPDKQGVIVHQCIMPVEPGYREWIEERARLRDGPGDGPGKP